MSEYIKSTDSVHEIKLESIISNACWDKKIAPVGSAVHLVVLTQFVGNGAKIKLKVMNRSAKTLAKIEGKMYANRFVGSYTITENAGDAIYYEAELPKHGLKMNSHVLRVIPPVKITNVKWDKQEARRGDILKLTADIKGVPDGTEAIIEIWEYDEDGAHDFITKFPALVENKKVEAEWEFEYHEDTDEIPTAEESERGYNLPEYFFRVKIGGVVGESGLVEFKDWIEIELKNGEGDPIPNIEFKLIYPDGSNKNWKLDDEGKAKIQDVPPGRYDIEFHY